MDRVTSQDGTIIAFDRSGEGPPVILVGGAFQHRAGDPQTARLASLLAPRFTVFHYDRRGRGDSGDTPPYDVLREVEDLEALVDAAGGTAFAFGMSSGAALVLASAARGLVIGKLALYELPFDVGAGSRLTPESYGGELTALLAEGRRGDAAALAMRTFGAPPEAISAMRQSPGWASIEAVAPTLAYDDALLGDRTLSAEWLATIIAPSLVIDGGASPAPMRDAARALANSLPGARHVTLEGQTHDVAPEALAPVLMDFFAG